MILPWASSPCAPRAHVWLSMGLLGLSDLLRPGKARLGSLILSLNPQILESHKWGEEKVAGGRSIVAFLLTANIYRLPIFFGKGVPGQNGKGSQYSCSWRKFSSHDLRFFSIYVIMFSNIYYVLLWPGWPLLLAAVPQTRAVSAQYARSTLHSRACTGQEYIHPPRTREY